MGIGLLGSSVAFAAPMVYAGSDAPPVAGNTVTISTVQQLLYVDQHQDSAIGTGTTTNYLKADLVLAPGAAFDLSGQTWIPMGRATDPFEGTFDGNGDVISGLSLHVSGPFTVVEGLFGEVANATISGVTLEQETLDATGTIDYVGGLVGRTSGHTHISDITGSDIQIDATLTLGALGGIVGGGFDVELDHVDATGVHIHAVGTEYTTGSSTASSTGFAGGIAGFLTSSTVTHDIAAGVDVSEVPSMPVSPSSLDWNGGLIGAVLSGTVADCAASGSISDPVGLNGGLAGSTTLTRVSADEADAAVSSGYANGGLVGLVSGATVSGSVAEGAVTAPAVSSLPHWYADGGLVGWEDSGGMVAGSIAVGSVDGSIAGPGKHQAYNGGLVGLVSSGTVKTSYAAGTVSGSVSADSGSLENNGGLIGAVNGANATVVNAYAMGTVEGLGHVDNGGLVGAVSGHVLTLSDAYFGGTVAGGSASVDAGIVGAMVNTTSNGISDVAYNSGSVTQAVGSGATTTSGSVVGRALSAMEGPIASGPLNWLSTSSGWTELAGIHQGLPILGGDLVPVLTPASLSVKPSTTDQVTVGIDYLDGQVGGRPVTAPVNIGTVGLTGIDGGFSANEVLTGSTKTVAWRAPAAIGTSMWMGFDFVAPVLISVSNAALPASGQNALPPITTQNVNIGGTSGSVISSLGYNGQGAISSGNFSGYVTERSALEAGLSPTGEGGTSAYVIDVLSGDGVAPSPVPAVEQGQFAALYQKLGILPGASSGANVTAAQAVSALLKAKASTLAIENYLMQLDGFTWAAASAEAAQGFPIQNG